MFIDSQTLRRVNIQAPYKGFSRLDTPEIRTRAGVIEIADPARGNDEIEYTQELDEPPYIRIDPKSQEQIDAHIAAVAQRIADEEAHETVKADATITYLVKHTPAECYAKVQADVTDLASAKVMLGRIAMALSVLARKELR